MEINPFYKSIEQNKAESLLKWDLKTTLERTDPRIEDMEWYIPMSFVDYKCIEILENCIDPKNFEEIGKLCVKANKVANYKYGENKAKLMEQIGVVNIETRTSPHEVKTTKLGESLLLLKTKDAFSIMIRLSVGIPVIHYLLSNAENEQVNMSSVFPRSFKQSTIKRRSSSIIHIMKDIETEYHCKDYTSRLISEAFLQSKKQDRKKSYKDDIDLMMNIIKKRSNVNSESGAELSEIGNGGSEQEMEITENKNDTTNAAAIESEKSMEVSADTIDNKTKYETEENDEKAISNQEHYHKPDELLMDHPFMRMINSFPPFLPT